MRIIPKGAQTQTANTTGQPQDTGFVPKMSPKQRAIEAWKKASESQNISPQMIEKTEEKIANTAKSEMLEASQSLQNPAAADTIEGISESASSPAPEAVKSEPAPASTPEEPISSQYAILARKEKALRAKMAQDKAALDAERAKLDAERAALKQPTFDQSKYISKEDLLKNPFDILAQAGLSYDSLVDQAVNAPKAEDVRLMQLQKQFDEREKALRDEIESFKKSQAEKEQSAYQNALKQISGKVNKLVDSNPEFETIKATGSQKDVVDLIEKKFKEDGIVLTEEEAAKEVEDYLVEEALKLAKISKLQKLLKPAENTSQPAVKQDASSQPVQQGLKTLTNSVTTTKKLSSRERALRAFRGEKID